MRLKIAVSVVRFRPWAPLNLGASVALKGHPREGSSRRSPKGEAGWFDSALGTIQSRASVALKAVRANSRLGVARKDGAGSGVHIRVSRVGSQAPLAAMR